MTTPSDPSHPDPSQQQPGSIPPPGAYPPPGSYPPPPPGYPPQGFAPPIRNDYASWIQRVGAALIDYVGFAILGFIFAIAGVRVLAILLYLIGLAWGLYNAYLGGQTGQSVGKKQLGIRLIRESDGAYIGGGAGIGRYFVHILDGLPCDLGYLWPLWDQKRQTFADKIMGTIVVTS